MNYFQDFDTKAMKAKYEIWKRKQTKPLNTKIFQTTTIHPGIFGGRALWADSGPPRMNTIVSRDQFKPIRIREILVGNYKGW